MKGILIFILIIVFLVVGYFIINYIVLDSNEEGLTENEELLCDTGNYFSINIPYEYYDLIIPINSLETHDFQTQKQIELCCGSGRNINEHEYKICLKLDDNSMITHEIIWDEKGGEYVKLSEYLPWQGTYCTYDFDSSGQQWAGRYCSDDREGVTLKEKSSVVVSECDGLEEGLIKWRCYDDVAEQERDLSICNKIYNYNVKWGCYYGIAFVKNDISMCDLIESDTQKEICLNDIGKSPSLETCDIWKNQPSAQAECLRTVGIMMGDQSICDMINEIELRDSCYMHVSLNTENPSLCDKIDSSKIKNLCIEGD